MKIDREALERRVKGLQAQANQYLSKWRDIKEYINPVRGSFEDKKKKRDYKIMLNEHPRRCARTVGSGMASGMTSEARPWFKLGLDDANLMELDSVKLWLDELQRRMNVIYSRSNIYSVLGSVYEEMATFGTGVVMILDDPDTIIRARNFTAGTFWLGRDAQGKPNAFARRYWATIEQMIEKFGIDNVTDKVKSSYKSNKEIDKWISIIHLIEKNDDRIPDKADFRNMAYRSIQWEEGSHRDNILRIGGYHEFPVLAPRWATVVSTDTYGVGLGEDALGASKMLQKMERKKLLGLDKTVDPPVQKSSMSDKVNTLPGGVSSYSATTPDAGVKPVYQVSVNFAELDGTIAKVEDGISKTFYTDLFMMLMTMDRKQITAYEISKKIEEREFVLGQVLQNIEDGLLDPLIDITFYKMLRRGLVPPIPPEIEGHALKVEYISILAQSQKLLQTANIERLVDFAGSVGQVNPETLDKIDWDEVEETYAEMLGVPAKLLRGDDIVKAIRQARAEAEQRLRDAEDVKETVKTIKEASEIKAEEVGAEK